MRAKCSGVDLHALDHSKVADKDSELASPDSGAADDAHNGLSGLLPDWTRSALEEVLGHWPRQPPCFRYHMQGILRKHMPMLGADNSHQHRSCRQSAQLDLWTGVRLDQITGWQPCGEGACTILAETAILIQIPYASRSDEAHANVEGI